MEKGPAEEKLEGTLVHLKAKQPVVLHWRGPQRLPGEHNVGWKLLCGGERLKMIG